MYESRETQLEHEVHKLREQVEEARQIIQQREMLIKAIDQDKKPMLDKIDRLQTECSRLKALNHNIEIQMSKDKKENEIIIKKLESRWACVYIALIIIFALNIVNIFY